MTTGDEAAVASAAAAAVAALASWASVLQGGRIQRRALRPRLHIQTSYELDLGGMRIRVENTGGGFASEVYFWCRSGRNVAMGGLPPHASLGPGKGVTLRSVMVPPAPSATEVLGMTEALVIWRYGTKTYAQAGAPSHRGSWSRHKWAFWSPKSRDAIVQRFFPGSPSIDALTLIQHELISPE